MTQAVKSGDVSRFDKVIKQFSAQFTADHTYTLITRLHHNVIKTAVKTISLAYSKITFADIAEKLHLDSPEDAEFIVAKAIRDGVIEAELDHRQGIMQSKDTSDVYSTREPQIAFNQRIEFCLDLHNHSVCQLNNSYDNNGQRYKSQLRPHSCDFTFVTRYYETL